MAKIVTLEDNCANLRQEVQSSKSRVNELELSLQDNRREVADTAEAFKIERESLLDQVKLLEEEREQYVLPSPGGSQAAYPRIVKQIDFLNDMLPLWDQRGTSGPMEP